MSITPTTTIVASPQAGTDRFFFWQIGNDLQNDWGSGPAGIFVNGSDQYVVLFHCVNFGVLSDNQHWQYSVFKNGTQQDSSNEPLVINPSANPTKQYSPNICVQKIGTDLYIIYWNRSGNLEIKVFHMATDLFGSTLTSSLTPGTGPTVGTGGPTASDGGLISTYNPSTDKITIIHSGFSIPISGQNYQRPAFVQYTVGTDTWGTFTITGHDSSVLFAESCYGGATLDCRGATNFTISQYDTDTPIMTIFFQSVYSDASLSAVQATGATATGQPASCLEACGEILCTGTEFVIPYTTARHASTAYRDGINVARATVPLTNTLPVSWTIQAVHPTGGATLNIQGIRLFMVGANLVLPYTGLNAIGNGTQISCAVWDGATWTDEATLLSPLTVLMVRGANGATNAIITYDFTATAVDTSAVNNLGGIANDIFGLVSLTAPVCVGTCQIVVSSPSPSTVPCANITPHPATDVQFKLIKIMATMLPAKRLPTRGSVQ